MKAGDKVIITKAVGTGALFAAHMRGLIEGTAVTNALDEMRKSNQQAARVLRVRECVHARVCSLLRALVRSFVFGVPLSGLRASVFRSGFPPNEQIVLKLCVCVCVCVCGNGDGLVRTRTNKQSSQCKRTWAAPLAARTSLDSEWWATWRRCYEPPTTTTNSTSTS